MPYLKSIEISITFHLFTNIILTMNSPVTTNNDEIVPRDKFYLHQWSPKLVGKQLIWHNRSAEVLSC